MRHASKANIGRTKNDSLSVKTLSKRIRMRRGPKKWHASKLGIV